MSQPLPRALVASCDAAQSRARSFLEGRGFSASGVTFVQRWDGDAESVPRAFASCTLVTPRDPIAAEALLSAVLHEVPLKLSARDATLRIREAFIEGHRVVLVNDEEVPIPPTTLSTRTCNICPSLVLVISTI